MSLVSFLNDVLAAKFPHQQTPEEYQRFLQSLMGNQQPEAVNVTGAVPGLPSADQNAPGGGMDVGQRQGAGLYDQGPSGTPGALPGLAPFGDALKNLPPGIGTKFLLDQIGTQTSPEQQQLVRQLQMRKTIGDILSSQQDKPADFAPVNVSPQLVGDGVTGTRSIPNMPAPDTMPAVPTGLQGFDYGGKVTPASSGLSSDLLRSLAIKAYTNGGNPADVTALMNIGKGEQFDLAKGTKRYDQGGNVIASNEEPQAAPLSAAEKQQLGFPAASVVTRQPNGSFAVDYKPPEAAPYRPLSQQELSDKTKLAGAEAGARAAAAAPEAGDENVEAQAQAIANYQQAPMSGFALARPFGQAVMSRVLQLNPQWNAQNFTKSNQAYKDFGSGKKGDLVRSFNVGISHLNTLSDLTDALQNGNIQTVNAVANRVKQEFGSTAPTSFDAAKAIVGDEIIKAIIGGGGALADRENAQNQINSAKTPAQLKGVIDTYQKLMAGQLTGLKRQYEQSTMRTDFESLLSDETKAKLEGGGTAAGAPPETKTLNGVTYHKVNGQWMQ